MSAAGRSTTLVRPRGTAVARPSAGLRRRAAKRYRTTPGRLSVALAVLVALGLAAGIAGMTGIGRRAGLIDGVTTRGGQLALAAQNLYRSLYDADATVASAFLSNGLEPPELRERYRGDIADATAALAVVSGGGTEVPRAAALARITGQLPVYTGLVETARTYNRQGLPLGAAYLQEASGLMRGSLLPAAQELYRAVSAELDAARDRAARFPWFAVLLGLSTVTGLVLVQVYLTRRTNRLVNPGLLISTVAGLAIVAWLTLSALTAAGHLSASREDGSAQVNRLAEARAAGLQARADEALTLVARGNGASFEKDFGAVMQRLVGADGQGGVLADARARATDDATRQAVGSAIDQANAWLAAHRALRALDDNGDYGKAVAAAVGTGGQTTSDIFNSYDKLLGAAITSNGARFDREAHRAAGALTGGQIGIAALAAALVIGAAVGLQRRIAEYR